MLDGKKHVIEKTISKVFLKFKLKYKVKPTMMLFVILLRLRPLVGFIPKRLGGN
jgi:hypothetical protein